MKTKNKNAALYHRVSTTEQDETAARDELRLGAATRGLAVALEVEETGSGAKNNRPGLQRILRAAERGALHAVLVWKLDRFGRSALDLLSNLRRLEDAGVRFIAVSQGIDIKPGGDPMSRLLVTMLAAIAEFERDLIIERTRLGLAEARRRGTKLGRPRVSVDVERAHKLRATGLSVAKTAAKLGVGVGTLHRALRQEAALSGG